MIRLKVCGITSLADAMTAIDCGAEYLGFNFYPPSPRYLLPESAAQIIRQLPAHIITVGIFVNEPTPDEVNKIMQSSRVQMAQLHGDEDAEFCAQLGAERVIKALRISPDFLPRTAQHYPAAAILLDAYDKQLYGGTGKTANWQVAREVAGLCRTFLAGGLAPDNVVSAVQAVNPFAVDVNSGVESAPGKKDVSKLRALRSALDSISNQL